MADVKVSQLGELGYFNSQASAYTSSVASVLGQTIQHLRTNLNDAESAVRRIREDVAELKATCDEESWYLVIAREQQLSEAREALSQLKSVFAQLLDEIHATRSQVSSLTSEAASFVTRYANYLQSR